MKKFFSFLLLALSSLAYAQAPAPTIIPDIDEIPGWSTCGACGNTGGTGGLATYSQVTESTLSRDGYASQFTLDPAGHSWLNAFWYLKRYAPKGTALTQTNWTYEFDVYVPSASSGKEQIEFQAQARESGWVYNLAWQGERSLKVWRYFDYVNHKWIATQVPYALAPDTWHHVKAVYHIDPVMHFVYHDSIAVDGVVWPLTIQHAASYSGSTRDYESNAFQLDGDKAGDKYSVIVDKMQLVER